ncbi:MAG: hypothetical protein QOH69_1849 [Actinomycetota bacterium]|nr:hypothetical protein [Actinomycetota bacterium]
MTAERALAQIDREVAQLFTALAPVAAGFGRVASLAGPIVRDDLLDVRGAISDVLGAHPSFVAGCGVVPAPNLLADAPYWMEWFWSVPDRDPEALRVNLEPAAPDFFDYTTADWFVTPERTGQRHIAGPYVDYVCTNEYATTVALPVQARGEFVGIVALDVTVSGWERRILPALRAIGDPVTLTNASGRVIASTSALRSPGRRIDASDGARLIGSTAVGWRLLREEAAGTRH